MKKIFNYIALATLTLSVFACSQGDMTSSCLSDSKAVLISAQIGENDVTGGFHTRSNPLGNTKEEQTKFYYKDKISVTADNQDAVIYTLDDDWIPEDGKYLKWLSNEMLFTAYYPVNVNNASVTTFTVPSSYNSVEDLANADYMTYAGARDNASGNSVTLPMERKMVRFVFSTTFKEQYNTTDNEVSAIKIHCNTTGYQSGMPQTGDIDVYSYYLPSDGKFYALVAPTIQDANKTFLTITVKYKDTNSSEELTIKGVPETKAGYSYDVKLTVGKDKASMGIVEVSDWKTGEIIGSNASEILPASVDAANHAITTYDEGQLTNDMISSALASGTELKITGMMEDMDFSTLKTYLQGIETTGISIDMSDAIVKKIPENALSYLGKIGDIKLPKTVETIDKCAFEHNDDLNVTNFDELLNLKNIRASAFRSTGLENVILPQNIEKFGIGAFLNCNKLKRITIPEKINYIVSHLVGQCPIEDVVIKGNLTGTDETTGATLGKFCFGLGENLKSIDLSGQVLNRSAKI